MKTRKQTKQWYVFILLFMAGLVAVAQENGYLSHRIKPGDILYLDGNGEECFLNYRQWDNDNPPGEAQGVVFYSYYGTSPFGLENEPSAWHGWVVSLDESGPLSWAPENSCCYDTCVALYPVEGINTPWNPYFDHLLYAIADTCGWQNTKRFLEYVYTGKGLSLSESISPAFMYLFAEKNGVVDFTQKPLMKGDSWYLMGYGQLRVLYGVMGCVNTALAACGGTLFTENEWYSSTEVGGDQPNVVWCLVYDGSTPKANGWLKKQEYRIRPVRSF